VNSPVARGLFFFLRFTSPPATQPRGHGAAVVEGIADGLQGQSGCALLRRLKRPRDCRAFYAPGRLRTWPASVWPGGGKPDALNRRKAGGRGPGDAILGLGQAAGSIRAMASGPGAAAFSGTAPAHHGPPSTFQPGSGRKPGESEGPCFKSQPSSTGGCWSGGSLGEGAAGNPSPKNPRQFGPPQTISTGGRGA